MTEREQAKVKVKRLLRSPQATGEQITHALTDYFKKYTMGDILKENGRGELLADLDNPEPTVNDLLTLFDGNVV